MAIGKKTKLDRSRYGYPTRQFSASIDSDKSIVNLVTDKGYYKASLMQELYWEQAITIALQNASLK